MYSLVGVDESELRSNPEALPGADSPRIGLYQVNGADLYAEVRGSGPVVLLVGAGDEDAEVFRPIAERLTARTVLTYDRRGTLRSSRDGWPGGGSKVHADDAAGLVRALGLDGVTVFGASAGGIVGFQAALRHPDLVRRALIFEPGYFRAVPGGEDLARRGSEAVDDHLAENPNDWVGASAALGRAIAVSVDPGPRGFFTPPDGKEWYTERMDANAEAFIRDDLDLTRETVDETILGSAPVQIRFAFGTRSLPIFEQIVQRLSALCGQTPDRLDGVGHGVYYHPDQTAAYILNHTEPR